MREIGVFDCWTLLLFMKCLMISNSLCHSLSRPCFSFSFSFFSRPVQLPIMYNYQLPAPLISFILQFFFSFAAVILPVQLSFETNHFPLEVLLSNGLCNYDYQFSFNLNQVLYNYQINSLLSSVSFSFILNISGLSLWALHSWWDLWIGYSWWQHKFIPTWNYHIECDWCG